MYKPIPNYPNPPPPGLNLAVEAAGILLRNYGNNEWQATDPDGAQTIADAFDPLDLVKSDKAAELADARWRKETGGFMFQPAGADRPYLFDSSQRGLTALLLLAVTIQKPREWKTAETDEKGLPVFVLIAAEDIPLMAEAINAHVDVAFAEEKARLDAVKAATDWRDVVDIKINAVTVEAADAVKK